MESIIRATALQQHLNPQFAEFCVTHVTDPKYSFLYNAQDPGHALYVKELAKLSTADSGIVAKRPRTECPVSSVGEAGAMNFDDALYNSMCEAAEKDKGSSEDTPRSFYFSTRSEFDSAMRLLRRAIGWTSEFDDVSPSEEAMEAFVVYMFRRRTRTMCFLQLLAGVSLLLWREEQRRHKLQCHIRRGNVFYVAVMLLLRHLEHLTVANDLQAKDTRKSLLYGRAFEKHLPLISSLGAQRIPASVGDVQELAVSDECARYVQTTVQSFADGQMLPEVLVAKLRAATRTVIVTAS